VRHRQGVRAPRAAAAVHFPTNGPASGVATRLACKLHVGARASAWFRRWNRNLRLLRTGGSQQRSLRSHRRGSRDDAVQVREFTPCGHSTVCRTGVRRCTWRRTRATMRLWRCSSSTKRT